MAWSFWSYTWIMLCKCVGWVSLKKKVILLGINVSEYTGYHSFLCMGCLAVDWSECSNWPQSITTLKPPTSVVADWCMPIYLSPCICKTPTLRSCYTIGIFCISIDVEPLFYCGAADWVMSKFDEKWLDKKNVWKEVKPQKTFSS